MSLEIPLEGQGRTMSLLKDKKILLTGVLSNRSIAYGIAKACHREGAQLALHSFPTRRSSDLSEERREGKECKIGRAHV